MKRPFVSKWAVCTLILLSMLTVLTETFAAIDPNDIWVNVKSFDATGDGITDDTSSIQSAIDYALSSEMQTVYFPEGQYRISTALRVGAGTFCSVSLVGGFNNPLSKKVCIEAIPGVIATMGALLMSQSWLHSKSLSQSPTSAL